VRIENNKLDEPLLIFPNPFTDELNLVINSKAEGTVRITLFSSLGKKILDYELPVTEGMNETVISDNRLIPAVYYLRVTSPEATITLPVVKMRR